MNNQYHNNNIPLNSTVNGGPGGTMNLLSEMGFTDSMIKDMKNSSTDNVTLINFALSAQSPFANDHDNDFLSLLNNSTSVLNNNHHNNNSSSNNNHQQLPQIDNNHQQQSMNDQFNNNNQQQNQQQQFQFNQNQNQQLNQSSSSMYLNKSMDNSGYYNNLLSGNQNVPQQQQSNLNQHLNLNQNNFNNFNSNGNGNGSSQQNIHNNLFSVPHSPQLPQVENIRSSSSNFNGNLSPNGYSQGINYDHTLPPIHTNISEPSSPINQMYNDNTSPPTSTNSSSSQLPKYNINSSQQMIIKQQQQQQPIFNPFNNSIPVQQPNYQHSISLPISPPITNQTGKGPQIEIVNSYTQPFPIYTVKTHVLVPAPILKVTGYHGDANDLMIIANPEPDDSIAISQPAVTCADGTFEFKFGDMHVDRKKHDPCNVFKLKFNLLNRKTFERFHEITSPAIELYYHTDMLPAPNIARLVPNSCYCSEEPEITVYGYYFKKGRSEILHVDFQPINPSSQEHRLQTIKQDDLHMPSQTSFSFSFAPPQRSTPGVYHVSARYTKTSTKKDRNQSNKSKVGNHQVFIYNELPESGSTKRFKKSPIDSNSDQNSQIGDDNSNSGYSYGNSYSLAVQSPSSPPTSSTSSPPNNYYQNCAYTVIHEEVEDIEELLSEKSKEEINAIVDQCGNSLLLLAAREGRDDMFEKLLELGCSVEKKNLTSHTVFHMACVGGNIDIVDQLVELGEQFYELLLTEKDNVGATALHIAVEKGHYRLVQHLLNNDYCDAILESRDQFGLTPFHYAVQDGNQRITSIFIKHFLDCSSSDSLNIQDYTGMTSLHWAAALGRTLIAKQLINAGANLNIVDGDNESPIFKSIVTNNKEITKLLIQKGTNSSIINNHSKSYIQLLIELSSNSENIDNNNNNSSLNNNNNNIIVGEEEEEEKVIVNEEEEKEKLIESSSSIKPVNVKQSSKTNLNSDLLNQFSKLNIITNNSSETPGNNSSDTTTTTTTNITLGGSSSGLTKFQPFKPTPGETFIPTAGGTTVDDFFSWTSRDITVNRFEILINQIEQNLLQSSGENNNTSGNNNTAGGNNNALEKKDKTKKLTTLLQQSFTDKFSEWMNCEEELLATKRDKLVLEEELSVKAHEIIKLTDFIQSCPINLGEIKENTLGLFILKRERYFGFHQSETLVIVSNDSMQAIKKIYGNQLPSCLIATILFIGKTKSTKPSQIMPIAGTEFYVVDIEIQKQKGIVPE